MWSVGRDDAHTELHDGMAFVTGTAHNLREPHKGGTGQFAHARSPAQRGKLGGVSPGSPRRGNLGSRDQRGGPRGTQIDFYETRGSVSPMAFGEEPGTFYPSESDAEPPSSAAKLRSEIVGAREGDGGAPGHAPGTYVAVSLDFSTELHVVCRLVPTAETV